MTGGALSQKLHEISGVDECQSSNYRDWDRWDRASRAVWIPDGDRIKKILSMDSNSNTQLFRYSRIAVTRNCLAEYGHLSNVSIDAVRIARIEVEGRFGTPFIKDTNVLMSFVLEGTDDWEN